MNQADYTNVDGSHRLRSHTRSERLRQSVLAMDGDRISSVRLTVVEKSKTDHDPDAGTTSREVDPASGRTYVIARDHDDLITSLTRDDGSPVTPGEKASVADSAFGLLTRSAFREIPARPLAVGEELPFRRDDQTGTFRIAAVHGRGDRATVDVVMTAHSKTPGSSHTSTTLYSLSQKTGWLRREEVSGEVVTTGDSLPAGCIKAVSKTTTRAIYSDD